MNDCTILIPTIAEIEAVRNKISHLLSQDASARIMLADGGPGNRREDVLRDFGDTNVSYIHRQKGEFRPVQLYDKWDRIFEALGVIDTEFVILAAVDDFTFLGNHLACLDLLRADESLVTVSLPAFQKGNNQVRLGPQARGDQVMERLRENGVNPNSLFWSCHRRDALKVAVDAMRYTPGNVIFPEFMFNLAILIQGETAVLPYPGTVRDLFSVGQKRPSDPAHLALSGLIETLPVAAAYIVTTAIGLFEERHGKPPPTMENDILSLLLFYLHLIRTSVDVLGKLPGAREQKSGFFTALRAYLQKDGRGAEDAKVLMRAGCGR